MGTMGVLEIISAILLILSCLSIIIIVFLQGSKQGGMSGTITGQNTDNYYERNSGRSKETRLKRLTVFLATLFFCISIGVNIVAVYSKSDDKNTGTGSEITDKDYENEYSDILGGTDATIDEHEGHSHDENGNEITALATDGESETKAAETDEGTDKTTA